jgi:hypothetical protein
MPLLMETEAFNGLILGIPARLRDHPGRFVDAEPARFSVVVDDGDDVWAAAVRTPPNRLIVAAREAGCSPALALLADHVHATDADVPGVVGPTEASRDLARRLAEGTGATVTPGMTMLVYELRQVRERGSAPGRARHAATTDADLLTDWVLAFNEDVGMPVPARAEARRDVGIRIAAGDAMLWEDEGRVVSLASRSRPTPNGMTINAVYTPPSHRGRGYATACVAELSQQELDRGYAFCTLFADTQNPTSNGIYQRIGYQELGEFSEFDLEGPH